MRHSRGEEALEGRGGNLGGDALEGGANTLRGTLEGHSKALFGEALYGRRHSMIEAFYGRGTLWDEALYGRGTLGGGDAYMIVLTFGPQSHVYKELTNIIRV